MPGLKPEEVTVEAEDHNLIVRGETKSEQEKREQDYWYTERRSGTFYRRIPLPAGVDPKQARAAFHDGVLEITIPGGAKELPAPRQRIPIAARTPAPVATGTTNGKETNK